MACTVPKLFGFRDWFESKFKALCDDHDALYLKRVWKIKWMADFLISAQIAERGYVALAIAAFIYNAVLGTPYWLWKKYKP